MIAARLIGLLVLSVWLAACARERTSEPSAIVIPAGALCRMLPDGGMQCAPPAPASYTLTITVSGTGQADSTSVTPLGPQPAATTRTLAVVPSAGSTFAAWSTGCAATMPQPAADTVCVATVNASGPPPSGAGEWTKLASGGRPNWYYNLASVCESGEAWMAWNGITSRWAGGTAPTWTDDATTNSMGWRENFATACVGNVVQIAPGTSGPPEWSGFVTYDMATKTYKQEPYGGCNAHSALGHDPTRNRLLTFGGWSTNCALQARTLPTGAYTPLNPSGPQPPLTADESRETSRRGGVDSRTGDAWVLADNRELYRYTAATNAWALVQTQGPKPPAYAIAALHEAASTIVAITGCPGLNDQDCQSLTGLSWWERLLSAFGKTPRPRATFTAETYLLDLASATWRLGPTGAAAPELMPMAKRHAVYDKKGQRVLMFAATYAPDSAGKLGTNIYAWTPSGGTPPIPITSYNLTVTTAGAGTASASPTGPQPAGTTRTLTATPTGAGTVAWSPAPCAPSFPQPASDLTCLATFTTDGPPVPPVAAGVWTTRALCAINTCPYPKDRQTKDVQWTWNPDTRETIHGTGDFSTGLGGDSGATPVYAYRMDTGTWRTLSTFCHASGKITPNHQQDKGPFSYDSKRKWLWLSTSTPFPDQAGQVCNAGTPSGSTFTNGLLAQDLSGPTPGDWRQVLPNAVGALSSSAYNAKLDELLYMGGPGPSDCAAVLVVHRLSDHVQTRYPLCLRPSPAFNSSSGGWAYAEYAERAYLAWDEAGQAIYGVFVHRKLLPSGNVQESKAVAYKFSRATNTWSAITPDPPIAPNTQLTPSNMAAAWVDLDARLYYAVISDPCARVHQLLSIRPGDAAWQSIEVHPNAHGSTMAVDQASGTLMFAGSVFCTDYMQHEMYLWRRGETRQRRP